MHTYSIISRWCLLSKSGDVAWCRLCLGSMHTYNMISQSTCEAGPVTIPQSVCNVDGCETHFWPVYTGNVRATPECSVAWYCLLMLVTVLYSKAYFTDRLLIIGYYYCCVRVCRQCMLTGQQAMVLQHSGRTLIPCDPASLQCLPDPAQTSVP